MTANELRIGNLVQYNLKSGVFDKGTKVTPLAISLIDATDFVTIVRLDEPFNNTYQLTEIEPIPLTEEWYNKLEHSFDARVRPVYSGNSLKIFDRTGICIKVIRMVHDYQNFHFALTGQELTLK